MDQQKPKANPPHVPTEEEIARLEAEAVAALQRGEGIPRGEAPRQGAPQETEAPARPGRPAFVPYVDDVPDPKPEPVKPKVEPAAKSAEPTVKSAEPAVKTVEPADEAEADDDDDDEPYIPSEWEKRIDALTPQQWKRWQIAGGAVIGLACVASMFLFGPELSSYGLIVAVVLALLLPRYLERAWRRSLNTARRAMIVALVIGLAAMLLITGIRTGFRVTNPS